MSFPAAVALLLVFCISFGDLSPAAAALERHAILRSGAVTTTRLLVHSGTKQEVSRSLRQEESTAGVWLLGLPHHQQMAVHESLKSLGGHVLHPVPGTEHHHWLVHATEGALTEVLSAHPEATAAPLPLQYKLSPAVLGRLNSSLIAVSSEVVERPTTLWALLPTGSPREIADLVDRAHAELATAGGPNCTISAGQSNSKGFRVTTCQKGVKTVAAWMASQPKVTYVDVVQKMVPQSNLLASAVVQNPAKLESLLQGKPSKPLPKDILSGIKSDWFPYWKAGLTGKDQIVGVVDTGLDMDSCFLWDPAFKKYQNGSNVKASKVAGVPYSLKNKAGKTWKSSKAKSVGVQYFQSHTHRKVVQYTFFSDKVDFKGGHGTHVAATIAGSAYGFDPLQHPTLATGIAPGAKLAMMDVGTSKNCADDVCLDVESDTDPGQLYEMPRRAGARIMSTSLGYDTFDYSEPACFMLDAYTWAQQDTLHVVAAGNSGDQTDAKNTGTVTAFGSCKNTLAVGAAESWVANGNHYDQPYNLVKAKTKQQGHAVGNKGEQKQPSTSSVMEQVPINLKDFTYAFTDSSLKTGSMRFTKKDGTVVLSLDGDHQEWSPMGSIQSAWDELAGIRAKVVLLSKGKACKLQQQFSPQEPVVVLAHKTKADNDDYDPDAMWDGEYGYYDHDKNPQTCNDGVSLVNIKKAKAVGALFFWDKQDQVKTDVYLPEKFNFPSGYLYKKGVAQQLQKLVQQYKQLYVEWVPASSPKKHLPVDNVAWYSSWGGFGAKDLYDIRIKPDIVAPGYVTSAYSDGKYEGKMDQCMVVAMTGTSMATPVTSGSATLVRQYFTHGYYPSGSPCTKCGHEPSGPLLKATLIAGATAMKGVSGINSQPLAPPPSQYQGHGRVDLLQTLPLQGVHKHWRMQVVDGATFTTDGVSHSYKLEVLRNPDGAQKPFIASLVWNDFAAFPQAAQVLVNNLDLMVEGPFEQAAGGKLKRTTKTKLHWGNGQKGGDLYNNVERVYIPEAKPGHYTITVRSKYLFIAARPQPYALVTLGNIKGTLKSKYNPVSKQGSGKKGGSRKVPQKKAA